MTGTVIITGANGSVALGFVDHLLSSYPTYTLLATVRDPSDANSAKLSNIITSKPNAKAHIEALDLSSLADVRSFAEKTAERVKSGKLPPIKAIVCNAFNWSLSETKYTQDGLEASFQVGHLSHYLLILKLLGSMASDGRIVLLGSNAHYPDRPHPLTKLIAEIPEDVEQIVKPLPDEPGQEHDHAGKDLAELSVGKEFEGTRGYFLGVQKEEESPMTKDENKQRILWDACWRWAGLEEGETVLVGAAP
ncbi:hypothetical protein FSOLCH5_006694 [Fusarium solani]